MQATRRIPNDPWNEDQTQFLPDLTWTEEKKEFTPRMTWTEEQKAELSKARGRAAATIKNSEDRKKFIAKQGEAERKTRGKVSDIAYTGLKHAADVTSALSTYEKGIDFVPKTGPAKLHRGEAVLDEDEAGEMRAEKKRDRTSEVLGGANTKKGAKKLVKKAKKADKTEGGKRVHRITIRRGAKGGYIVERHFKTEPGEPAVEMEEDPILDREQLHQQIDEHMGDEEEMAPPPMEGEEPMPPPEGEGPAPPGMPPRRPMPPGPPPGM